MKKKMIILSILCAIFLFGAGMVVGAAGSEPGSNGDPLITKSYLDAQLSSSVSPSYKEVSLSSGESVTVSSGAQVIVTSGSSTAAASVVDVTAGKSLGKNKSMTKNHTYLITKEGTKVKAKKTTKVFVLGNYSK